LEFASLLHIPKIQTRTVGPDSSVPLVFELEYSARTNVRTYATTDTCGPLERLIILGVGTYINTHLAIRRAVAA